MKMVKANGLEFGYLDAGPADGTFALCLHGFPDSAHTWRHLLPALGAAGYHAVAPFMRGYAPTGVPADGACHTGALVADAVALHEAFGAADDAVLIGHDWGALAAYGAAAFAPDRWRRVVTMAVPPPGAVAEGFFSYEQIKRSFYIYLFQTPFAETAVTADGMAFLDRLWQDWSPGLDGAADVERVKECLRDPANLATALGYYRAMFDPARHVGYEAEQEAAGKMGERPVLYLHGAADGCMGPELALAAEHHLPPGSKVMVVGGAGHFVQLERPEAVNGEILAWIS